MVIVYMEACEKDLFMQDVYTKLDEAEADAQAGRMVDARQALKDLRAKYGV
jgi:soluble cytochrome b562